MRSFKVKLLLYIEKFHSFGIDQKRKSHQSGWEKYKIVHMKIPICWSLCCLVINWYRYMVFWSMLLLFRMTMTWHKYDSCDMMEANLIGLEVISVGIFEDYSQSDDVWKLFLSTYFRCTAFSSVPWYFNLDVLWNGSLVVTGNSEPF